MQLSSLLMLDCSVASHAPRLIQQNVDGSDFFNRSWTEFKFGFGDRRGNYWIGNELLSQLTLRYSCKLKFDLQSIINNNWYNAEYSTFTVLTEADNYELQVAGFSGNASHDALSYSNVMMFSTYDRDNDRSSGNCAASYGGGFWYKDCARCGFAGRYRDFYWDRLPGGIYLQTSRMWLQCE